MVYRSNEEVTLAEAKKICAENNGEISHCTSAQNAALKNDEKDLNIWCALEKINGHWQDANGVPMNDTDAQWAERKPISDDWNKGRNRLDQPKEEDVVSFQKGRGGIYGADTRAVICYRVSDMSV